MELVLFADDISVSYSPCNLSTLIRTKNRELKYVSNWLVSNKLSLNTDKINFAVCTSNKRVENIVNIKIGGVHLQRLHVIKYLGVMTHQNSTWKDHLAHIHRKISLSTGILQKVKHLITADSLLTLYYAMIYPYFHYCNVVWGMATKTSIKSLRILRKRIVTIISKVPHDEQTDTQYKNLRLLKRNDIHNPECLKSVHNTFFLVKRGIAIQSASLTRNINTRNRH